MSNDPRQDAKKIIVNGDVNALIDTAKSVGERLARPLTTNQIRNIFGEVRRIEMDWPSTRTDTDDPFRRVVLLQPKLAYQARRERGRGVEDLQLVLDPCLEEIRNAPREDRRMYFQRFVEFFEAILAYHKAAGGN